MKSKLVIMKNNTKHITKFKKRNDKINSKINENNSII